MKQKTDDPSEYMPISTVVEFVKTRITGPIQNGAQRTGDGDCILVADQSSTTENPSQNQFLGIKRKMTLKHLIEFWTGIHCEPDTLNQFILFTARLLKYEVNERQAVDIIEQYCREHPTPAFSDRLTSGRYPEVRRVIRATVNNVYHGDNSQCDPDKSKQILDRVQAYMRRIALQLADKSTWHRLSISTTHLGRDFEWTSEEVRQIRQHLVPVLKTDLATAAKVTKHFLRFVDGHCGQEISRDALPDILADFEIKIRSAPKKQHSSSRC